MSSLPRPHFAIFPFMSQGHTIPLLHLSHLLRGRSITVTIFTTAANSPSISATLDDATVTVIELPFPRNIENVPNGVESTQHLPSMNSFLPFVKSTVKMQESFERALETLNPPLSCIISDGFFGWTLESAKKFNVPRFVFSGMGCFSSTMYQVLLGRERPHAESVSLDEPFLMPGFPELKLTRNDFDPPFADIEPAGPLFDFSDEQTAAMAMSHGVIMNSFYGLEKSYVDYWNEKIGPKAFCVGPLCMAAKRSSSNGEKPDYFKFLDEKLSKRELVLYVSFGTQVKVPIEQLVEIAKGLERSEVSFLWAVRLESDGGDFFDGFEERVKIGNKGFLVKEWVDQLGILRHGAVGGFLSHCGWNSVVESISGGVPMVALPFMAEQHMNARFVAEVAGVGLRAMPEGGRSMRGPVAAEEVERVVRELMGGGGKGGETARRKAAEYCGAARGSMGEGGASTRALDLLIDEVCGKTASFSDGENCREGHGVVTVQAK